VALRQAPPEIAAALEIAWLVWSDGWVHVVPPNDSRMLDPLRVRRATSV
jgi:hypothetical protein